MLFQVFNIVAPVFLIIASGYLAVNRKVITNDAVDGVMKFAVLIAIPCLLFRATSTLDVGLAFKWRPLTAYYAAAVFSFGLSIFVSRKFFNRRPGEAVAIGFAALFSNLVMLGLPINERAWGLENMAPNVALIAVNAPICYLIGITAMEISRADGRSLLDTSKVVINAMFRNSLMIGISLGLAVNLLGIPMPETLSAAVNLIANAAIPVALFGLGGVLTRYSMNQNRAEAGVITTLSLVIQPALALLVGNLLELNDAVIKSIVLMSAMAPGLNAYLFSSMYQRGEAVAASSVVMATILSVITISLWLLLLR